MTQVKDTNDDKNCKAENSKGLIYKLNTWQGAVSIGALAAIALFSFSSFARRIRFQTSAIVPAARGYAKVNLDRNNNYNVYITLKDLAEPERLTPAKHSYIVWLVAEDDSTRNIGQIKTSAALLSGALKASFETVSITKPVKLFITAEDDARTQFPGSVMVLTTNEF